MGIVDGVIKFSIKKNLGKWVKGAATILVAKGASLLMAHTGVNLSPEDQAKLEVAVGSAFLGGANLLKIKFPKTFGWL